MTGPTPSNPQQEGSKEVFHDGMNDKGHEDQMHGGTSGGEDNDSGHEEDEK